MLSAVQSPHKPSRLNISNDRSSANSNPIGIAFIGNQSVKYTYSTKEEMMHVIQLLRADNDDLKSQINNMRSKFEDATVSSTCHRLEFLSDYAYKPKTVFKGHRNKVFDISLSSDERFIASVGQDRFALIWNSQTAEKIDAINLGDDLPLSIVISPSGQYIAVGGLSNICTVHPIYNGVNDNVTDTHVNYVGRGENSGRAIGSRAEDAPKDLNGNASDVSNSHFTNSSLLSPTSIASTTVISSGIGPSSSSVTVRPAVTPSPARSIPPSPMYSLGPRPPAAILRGHEGFISQMCYIHSDDQIVTASADMSLCVWDVLHSRRIFQMGFGDHLGSINSVDVHPVSPYLIASASSDGTAKIWDTRDPRYSVCTNADHSGEVTKVMWFPSGDAICTASADDHSVRIYDMRYDGTLGHYPLMSRAAPLTTMCPTTSGRTMLVGHEDGTMSQLDFLKNTWCQEPFTVHKECVTSIAVAKRGRIFTSGWDGLIRAYEPIFY